MMLSFSLRVLCHPLSRLDYKIMTNWPENNPLHGAEWSFRCDCRYASHCKPFGVRIHGCKTLSCTVAMGHDEPEKRYLPLGTGLKETWLQDVSGWFGQDCICTWTLASKSAIAHLRVPAAWSFDRQTVCKEMSQDMLWLQSVLRRPLPKLPPIDGSSYEKMLRGEPESKESDRRQDETPHASTRHIVCSAMWRSDVLRYFPIGGCATWDRLEITRVLVTHQPS